MKKPRVLVDFIKLIIAAKIIFYRNVIDKLTNNPYFPNPYISLADANISLTNLEQATLAAADGGHTATSNMHDKEKLADDDFRILAHYVTHMADGDETKIASSGFNQSKSTPAAPKPALSVKDGPIPGSVIINSKAIDKAGVYIYQSIEESVPLIEENWRLIGMSTHATYEASGYTPGTVVLFRMAAITPDGTTDFCVPVSKRIN